MISAVQHPICSIVLTPAEQAVAACLLDGYSNKEIATLLDRAEATIKHQISSVLRKSGVPSRSRFIAAYYQHNFGISPQVIACEWLPPRVRHVA